MKKKCECSISSVLYEVWTFLFAVYSNSAQEYLNTLLYSGFVEELVEVLELQDPCLTVSVKSGSTHVFVYSILKRPFIDFKY